MQFRCFEAIIAIIVFLLSGLTASAVLPIQKPFIVGAYYENWSLYRPAGWDRVTFEPYMIDTTLLTDLYYAFAVFGFVTKAIDPQHPRLTGDFTIQPIFPNEKSRLYREVRGLKERSGGRLRTFLSIGGANFNNPNDPHGIGRQTYRLFSQMASTPANRKQFIDSAISYAHDYGFDGIDIDWEFPGDVTRGGTEADFDNVLSLLQEAAVAFHAANPPLLLSFALPPSVPEGLPSRFRESPSAFYRWAAQCAKQADRVTAMAYNYHTPFEVDKITGVNAPLLRDTVPSSEFYVARTLEHYLNNGIAPEKMILGIPVYGWSYGGVQGLQQGDIGPGKPFTGLGMQGPVLQEPGILAYFEVADLIAQKQLFFGTDLTTSTANAYNLKDRQWVSFDTPETTALKVDEAKKRQLGGVVFWAIDLDEYQWQPRFPNIRAARGDLQQ